MRMTVKKILATAAAMSILAALAGIVHLQRTQTEIAAILGQEAEASFDAAVDAAGAPVKTFAGEYSYWDDLVRFVKTGNRKWADGNIAPALAGAKADAVWIYTPGFSPVYGATPRSGVLPAGRTLAPETVRQAFDGKRVCRFFAYVPEGLLEVHGATIHPTNDSARKGTPQGYLLAARLWTDDYVQALERESKSRITVVSADAAGKSGGTRVERGAFLFTKSLPGSDNTAAMNAEVRLQSVVAGKLGDQMRAAVAAAAAPLLILAATLLMWVMRPLALLAKSLEPGRVHLLEKLGRGPAEFAAFAARAGKILDENSRALAETARLRQEAAGKEIAEHAGAPELVALRVGKADLEKQLEQTQAKLHVVDELLQREIISEHEHHKAEMVASYEKERLERELSAMRAELFRVTEELQAFKALKILKKHRPLPEKTSSEAAPGISGLPASFTEANC